MASSRQSGADMAESSLDSFLGLAPNRPGHEGWLCKKSGGKEGKPKLKLLQKWTRRFFVLPTAGTRLSYYKSEDAYRKGAEPLGSVECLGATVFLKLVEKDEVHRFTVRSDDRELKLRAENQGDYQARAPRVDRPTDRPRAARVVRSPRTPAHGRTSRRRGWTCCVTL